MTQQQYELASQLGDPATAIIPWTNQGKPVEGYVHAQLFIFRLNEEVGSVEKGSVERSLKLKMGMGYR